LQRVFLSERGLHGMKLIALRQAFNRCDLGPLSLHREYRAGFDGLSIHKNRAGSALARITAYVRAGQMENFS
jgi:hypothetical protein